MKPDKPGRARLTEKELDTLLEDDEQTGYTELIRELHRARRSEAELLKALQGLAACSHGEGVECVHYRRAHAAIARAKGKG